MRVNDVSYLWNAIYGNDALKDRLISDITQNKLAHAYILEGPAYSGKLTLARTVAAMMADTKEDVKKILAATSPDVIEIDLSDKRKTIGVDTVREIKATAYIKPNDMDFKLYIVKHAETLTVQAQNAMLKLIEEPPKNVYFILLCENVTALLATIRSRAPILRMQLFAFDELLSLLKEHSPEAQRLSLRDPDALDVIVRSSSGVYGEALRRLSEEKNGSVATDGAKRVLCSVSNREKGGLLGQIQKLPAEREAFRETLEKIGLLLRDVISFRVMKEESEYLYEDVDTVYEIAERLSLDKLLSLDTAIASLARTFVANPNVQNLKTQLFIKLSNI